MTQHYRGRRASARQTPPQARSSRERLRRPRIGWLLSLGDQILAGGYTDVASAVIRPPAGAKVIFGARSCELVRSLSMSAGRAGSATGSEVRAHARSVHLADGSLSRVLVTGGAGFIGRHVVRALLDEGHEVTTADKHASSDERVRSVVGDLCDPAVIADAVSPPTDVIIHLAAVTSVLRSTQDPAGTYKLNVEATAALLEQARQRGVGTFLLASTNAVDRRRRQRHDHRAAPAQPADAVRRHQGRGGDAAGRRRQQLRPGPGPRFDSRTSTDLAWRPRTASSPG